jgi:hypothetical protein
VFGNSPFCALKVWIILVWCLNPVVFINTYINTCVVKSLNKSFKKFIQVRSECPNIKFFTFHKVTFTLMLHVCHNIIILKQQNDKINDCMYILVVCRKRVRDFLKIQNVWKLVMIYVFYTQWLFITVNLIIPRRLGYLRKCKYSWMELRYYKGRSSSQWVIGCYKKLLKLLYRQAQYVPHTCTMIMNENEWNKRY